MASESKEPRYTVIIQWSDEDGCFVASLPEWRDFAYAGAHGKTYEEAAKNAREVLELLMNPEPGQSVPHPTPRLFHYPGADVVDVAETSRGSSSSTKVKQSA